MPALDKIRWENYARNIAKGMTQADAYEDAGFTRSKQAASALANNPVILQRVQELRAERERILSGPTVYDEDADTDNGEPLVEVTMEWVIERLAANVVSAQSTGNHGAANKALEMLGHHLGLSFSDKKAPSGDEGKTGGNMGTGNTFNILQLTEGLKQHAAALEQMPMKDVTPEDDG